MKISNAITNAPLNLQSLRKMDVTYVKKNYKIIIFTLAVIIINNHQDFCNITMTLILLFIILISRTRNMKMISIVYNGNILIKNTINSILVLVINNIRLCKIF